MNIKSSELVRLIKKDGWLVIRQTASPGIMEQLVKRGQLVYPCHGSHEIGKDLERKNKKDAGLK